MHTSEAITGVGVTDLVFGVPLWLADTNCWVVRSASSSSECVLIDVPPEPEKVAALLKERSLRVVAIIATHGHIDHIGGVPALVERNENLDAHGRQAVPVHLHPADRHMMRDPVGNSGMLGQALVEAGLSTREPEIVEDISDGQIISGAGLRFRAIHTPGHTQGSTCFLADVGDLPPLLFSGDHLFAGSIGRTDLPGGSMEALMHSMEAKILPMSDVTVVLPGHGGTTTIGQERATNPFLRDIAS